MEDKNQAPDGPSSVQNDQHQTVVLLPNESQNGKVKQESPKRSIKDWFLKYFFEGQALSATQTKALEELTRHAPWHKRLLVQHRRLMGVVIPFVFFHMIWWSCAFKHNFWQYFPDKYYMSIAMLFGSIIAGMTSEGGGSVAFPIMTLAFSVPPSVARDFSLGIQSCGMVAAAFTIFWMHVQTEWHSILFCSLGGIVGIVFGLEWIDPQLTPPQKKMGFVCVWFSFAFALFLLNRYHKRRTFKTIPDLKAWKCVVLTVTGFAGGIFTSVSGSGLDICSFSILTLLFRVTEKTATPTSVVLMAGNTVVGFYWRVVMQGGVSTEVYEYMAVCVPIVVLGAPLGSVIGSHFYRQLLAALVYVTDSTALISGFVLVPQTTVLVIVSVSIVVSGFMFFGAVSYIGQKIMNMIPEEEGDETEMQAGDILSCERETDL